MFLKMITIRKDKNKSVWNHVETTIIECDRVSINDAEEKGKRVIHILRKGTDPKRLVTEKIEDLKTDIYIENDKGDTIGRY